MNSATANLIVLTAEVNEDKIVGTAIDGDHQSAVLRLLQSEVNQRLFLPEANLVISGKFRLGRDAWSVGISIAKCHCHHLFACRCFPARLRSSCRASYASLVMLQLNPSAKPRRPTRTKKAAKTPIAA